MSSRSNRAGVFFELFSSAAENIRVSVELLQDLVGDYREVD